jgi:hypothetical protein
MTGWVQQILDRASCSAASAERDGLGLGDHEKVVCHVVKEYAGRLGISKLAPHDLRRSCAKFCHITAWTCLGANHREILCAERRYVQRVS